MVSQYQAIDVDINSRDNLPPATEITSLLASNDIVVKKGTSSSWHCGQIKALSAHGSISKSRFYMGEIV